MAAAAAVAISSTASVSTTTTFASQHSLSAASLQENRRLAQRLLMDLVIFVFFLIPILICEFGIEPFRRGFFCNDETIRYPFLGNTVTPLMLGLLVGLVPACVLIIVELLRFYRRGQMEEVLFIFGWKMPTWLIECVQQMAYYAVGLTLTLDATELAKYTIGRLRPHFIAVCQPQLMDGSTCADAKNQFRYIEHYVCRANGFTALDVLESRRSFPSGHSSLAFYAMVYIAIYIQRRLTMRRSSKLARHFIQFVAVMLAWFTALSRIMDNWHHWSDVLAGSLIGIVGALLTARFIAKFHRRSTSIATSSLVRCHTSQNNNGNLENLKVSLPRPDTSATLDEVISTPPPYLLTAENSFSNEQYCTKV